MPKEPLIYFKQPGEGITPVTARVIWLPDGTLKPCLYWTPDGSCYEVKHIFESVHMAHLKERGVGLRFRVRAEIIETPEPCSDRKFAQHETYLYFSDNWFCGRNIIDSRYGHAGKEFITVTLDVFPDCGYELISFCVRGKQYLVEKTLSIEPHGSFLSGGIGVRHMVDAYLVSNGNEEEKDIRRPAALFFEINKWFVRLRA